MFFTTVNAQSLTWPVITGVAFGYMNGTVEGMQTEFYAHGLKDEALSKRWHNLQYGRYASGVAVGFTLYDYSKGNLGKIVKCVMLQSAVFWIVNDMSYNIARNRNVFYVSNQSGSFLEQFSHIGIKLIALSIAVLVNELF